MIYNFDPTKPARDAIADMENARRQAMKIQSYDIPDIINSYRLIAEMQPNLSDLRRGMTLAMQSISEAVEMSHQLNSIAHTYSHYLNDIKSSLRTVQSPYISDHYYTSVATSDLEFVENEIEKQSKVIESQTFNQKINLIAKAIYEFIDFPDLYDVAEKYELKDVYILITFVINRYASVKDIAAIYGFCHFLVELIINIFE